jgi:hypothetical protein
MAVDMLHLRCEAMAACSDRIPTLAWHIHGQKCSAGRQDDELLSCALFSTKRADVKRLEVLGIEGSAASMSSQRLMLSGEKASSGGQKGAGKLLALSKRQAIKLRERRTHTASDPSSTLQHRYTNNTRIYLTNRIYLDPRKLQIPPIPHAQKRSNTHQDAGPSDVCQ